MTTIYGSADQALVLGSNHPIALAGRAFEAFPVHDQHAAPPGADESRSLEDARRSRDRRPADAEHLREELLCQRNLVAGHAVVRQEKPAGATPIDRVQLVARRGLGDLREKSLRVTLQDPPERFPVPDSFPD